MSMSNYLENAIVNVTLRGIEYTSPSTVYAALYTSDPTDAGTGTEVSGSGYARQPAQFGAPTNGTVSNSADIIFPIATGTWGTVTHVGVKDAATNGNLLYSGALSTPQNIVVNNQLIFKAGQFSISID